jgi:predicted O-methyltransferase YrrM
MDFNIISDPKIASILAQYHLRMLDEAALMQSLTMQEGMKKRDEFLLSVGQETAIFLNTLVKSAKPLTILEIGTSYGYSTIWLAEAAKNIKAKVISLENDAKKANFAKQKLAEAGLGDVVEIMVGDAIEFLQNTNLKFDFILLDLWKELYIPCFDLFYPKLNNEAWVISDNMIFPTHSKPEMDIYRHHLRDTNAFDTILIPIGSGIEVSLFKQVTKN